MITVNLWDEAFRHNPGSSVHGKTARHIRYVRDRQVWPGVTLFTDVHLAARSVMTAVVNSPVKVGWLLEPREYKPELYESAVKHMPRLNLLLTHDQELIDRYPDKVRFVPFGGCWIQEANIGLHRKSKRVSMCYSAKRFLPGHELRHAVAGLVPGVDLYGHGSRRPVTYKEEALADYEFSIVIENSRARNFFTEKLLDCFAVGTVPVYWGCPNIGDFFDTRGIVQFQSIDDLPGILETLDYRAHMDGVRENLEWMRQYEITDDWIALNILQGLI